MSDLSIHEAVDLAESYVTRIAKPFEKVRDVLRAAIDAQAALEKANTQLQNRAEQIDAADATLARKQAEVAAYHEAAAQETGAIGRELDALREHVSQVRNEAQEQMNNARVASAAVIASAEADAAARKVALDAEIASLETRKAELDRTFQAALANVELLVGKR